MTTKHNWIAIVSITLAIVVAVGVFRWSLGTLEEAILPAQTSRSSSLELVDMTLTDPTTAAKLQLRIPKAYLTKAENRKGGEQQIIYIESRLPDMLPVSASPEIVGAPGSPDYESSMAAFNDGIYIHLSREHGSSTKGWENLHREFSNQNHTVGASRKYERVSDNYFGLERYHVYSCQKNADAQDDESCLDAFTEEFVTADQSRPLLHIICNLTFEDHIGFRQGCQAYTSHRKRSLSYVFRHSQMHRWQEFDAAVRQLLERFVVDTTDS